MGNGVVFKTISFLTEKIRSFRNSEYDIKSNASIFQKSRASMAERLWVSLCKRKVMGFDSCLARHPFKKFFFSLGIGTDLWISNPETQMSTSSSNKSLTKTCLCKNPENERGCSAPPSRDIKKGPRIRNHRPKLLSREKNSKKSKGGQDNC